MASLGILGNGSHGFVKAYNGSFVSGSCAIIGGLAWISHLRIVGVPLLRRDGKSSGIPFTNSRPLVAELNVLEASVLFSLKAY